VIRQSIRTNFEGSFLYLLFGRDRFRNWPDDIVQYNLRGRILDIIPTPRHQASHNPCQRPSRIFLAGRAIELTQKPGELIVDEAPRRTDDLDESAART